MAFEDAGDVRRGERHVRRPCPKAPLVVHGLNPLPQGLPLGLVLLRVLAFDLKDEVLAGLQSDEEVRDVFPLRAVPQIENMEAEVIALGVGGDVLGALDFVGFAGLPRGIENTVADVGFARGVSRLGRIPRHHVAGGGDGAVGVKDRLQFAQILLPQVLEEVRHRLIDVEREEHAAAQIVLMKQVGDMHLVSFPEGLDELHQLEAKKGQALGFGVEGEFR